MAPSHSSQEDSSASPIMSLSESSWFRRERNDTVLSTYFPTGHPARPKAITSPSQFCSSTPRTGGPSSSVPQLSVQNEIPDTSNGATSTKVSTSETLQARDTTRSLSKLDLSTPIQGYANHIHPPPPSVYIPSGTPAWIQHDLTTRAQRGHDSISSPTSHPRYQASFITVTELSVDPNAVLSGSTSVMSGSSSDHQFEMYARQGTWDSGSEYGKREIMWMWIRRCGEGVGKVKRGMGGKCKKVVKGICKRK